MPYHKFMYSQTMTRNKTPNLGHGLLPQYIFMSMAAHTLHFHNSSNRDQDIRTSHSGSLIWDTQTTSSPIQNSSHLYTCSHVLRQKYSSQPPWYNDTGIRMGRCCFPRWLLPLLLSVTPGCFMYHRLGTSALPNGILVDTEYVVPL